MPSARAAAPRQAPNPEEPEVTRPSSRPPVAGLAAATALLLSACASTGSEPPAPAPRMPSAWAGVLPAATANRDAAPAAGSFWAGFGDPVLESLVQATLQSSPDLASAEARLARARAAQAAADAALQPRLDLAGAASQGRSAPRSPTQRSASLGVQAAWELDLFGANRSAAAAAAARGQGAAAALAATRTVLAAEVASSYLALRGCEAQVQQVELDSRSRAETTRLTELSVRAGITAPAEAALARAGAAEARNQLVARQAACESLLLGISELVGLELPVLRSRLAAGRARLPGPPGAPGVELPAVPASLLANRPDLVEAERAVAAALAEVSQSRARERPSISLAGSIGSLSLRSAGESTSGGTWSFGPLAVSFPLFDAGARAAGAAAARASYEEAVALYQAQARRAVREVEQALVTLNSVTAREADARAAAVDFEASLRATEARQRGGLASLFDLEAARRNAVAAQGALIELQRERATAWVDLYRALGGGFDARSLATVPAHPS